MKIILRSAASGAVLLAVAASAQAAVTSQVGTGDDPVMVGSSTALAGTRDVGGNMKSSESPAALAEVEMTLPTPAWGDAFLDFAWVGKQTAASNGFSEDAPETHVAIPEPSSTLLAALAGLGFLIRRHRRRPLRKLRPSLASGKVPRPRSADPDLGEIVAASRFR